MNPGDAIGKYKIIKRLGGGSFGVVYLAHDVAMARETAIKVLKTSDPSEFMSKLKEAQILDKCRHKHIVQINDANVYDFNGSRYLVLDLEPLPDGSLESEIEKRWISIKETCARVSCMLAGLEYAHSNGYLHRDVKPANVLIAGEVTKLSDFGLATDSACLLGSDQGYLAHCPPEFYTTNTTSVLSDVFASGVTMFRVINNICDWGKTLSGLKNTENYIQNGTLIKRIGCEPFVPEKIRRIINKACSAESSKRYQSAQEMKRSLDALRFNIDWIRFDIDSWVGTQDGDEYGITLVRKRKYVEIVCKKKSRRFNALCATASTIESARIEAAQIVATTSLK